MKFQLQGVSSDDGIVIKQRYTKPQVIQVVFVNNGSAVRPTLPTTGIQKSDPCGANVFLGVDQIVQFKINGAPDCILTTEVTNAVKGRVRYDIDIDAFFAQSGPSKFTDNVVMILGIDPTRIRVVNIVPGSTVIEFHVIGANQGAANGAGGAAVTNELKGLADQLTQAVADGRMNILNAVVLDSEFLISVKTEFYDEPEEVEQTSSPILIIIVAGAVSIGIVLIGAYFVYRRYRNLKNKVRPNIANLTERYNLAKAGSQTNFIASTLGDLKIEDAEQQLPIKSIGETPSSKVESKITMFARGKSTHSNIWDRDTLAVKNAESEDM
jgi:hypothetical protein